MAVKLSDLHAGPKKIPGTHLFNGARSNIDVDDRIAEACFKTFLWSILCLDGVTSQQTVNLCSHKGNNKKVKVPL
jgi:hypothetical protein